MASGGVVFRVGEELCFLPAGTAVKVSTVPDIARVPGGPRELVGVAIVDGETLPILAAGDARSAMIVVVDRGERVGLVGVEVLATGRFEPAGEGAVAYGGGVARTFDVAALAQRVRETRWGV